MEIFDSNCSFCKSGWDSSRNKYRILNPRSSGMTLSVFASYQLCNLPAFCHGKQSLFWQILIFLKCIMQIILNACLDSDFLLLFLEGHWGKGQVLVWGLRKVVEIHSSWKLAWVLSLQAKLVIFPCRLRKKKIHLAVFIVEECREKGQGGRDRRSKMFAWFMGILQLPTSPVGWPVVMKWKKKTTNKSGNDSWGLSQHY